MTRQLAGVHGAATDSSTSKAAGGQQCAAGRSLPEKRTVALQRQCACGSRSLLGTASPGYVEKEQPLQRLLSVSSASDPLEREAEQIASGYAAMEQGARPWRTPARVSRFNADSASTVLTFPATPNSVDEVLSGSGKSLDQSTRVSMERFFGRDFSNVQVHSGSAAARSAADVGANAYTVGHNIVFGPGQYAPQTSAGRQLLAHELSHVVQQTGTGANTSTDRTLPASDRRVTVTHLARDENFHPAPMPGAMPVDTRSPPKNAAPARDEQDTGSPLLANWEQGIAVGKIGLVAVDEGTFLRPAPDTQSQPLGKLPLNTRVYVDRERQGGWYHVVLDDGREGFAAKANVTVDLPDGGARLHRIVPNQTALDIVKLFYKGHASQWGQDERFFVNVLVHANARHGRNGIHKPNAAADWDQTQTNAGSQIWIPSLEFAQSLKGRISSGSISYETYRAVADAAYAAGEFVVGGVSFVAGLLHGALESVWDTLVGLVELAGLAWKILKSLVTGNLLSDTRALFAEISNISPGDLLQAGLDWLDKKWNDPGLVSRWHFRGWIVGYAIAEIVMLVFTDGILTSIKAASKAGKFAEIISKFPKVAKFIESVKTGAKGIKELEAVKAGAKGLKLAREWLLNVLKVPARVVADIAADAVERLKRLPTWAQERFAQLSDAVKVRLLGCASPCKVNVEQIQKYLTELAAKGAAGATKLSTRAEVLAALPADLHVGKISQYLDEYPALMEIIKKANLTDKDFGKLADFLTAADKRNPKTAYQTFTRYLTQIVPAKTGPDIDSFNKIVASMVAADARQGAALKGPMFEAFARIHLTEFAGKSFERATFKLSDGVRTADRFVPDLGEVWEIKHQLLDKVPADQAADYLKLIGSKTASGAEVKSINYLFPTEAAARLNDGLRALRINVYFVKPPGVLTKLL